MLKDVRSFIFNIKTNYLEVRNLEVRTDVKACTKYLCS